MRRSTILHEPELVSGGPALDSRPDLGLEHVQVLVAALKPVDRQDLSIHNPNPGHHLTLVGLLAGHNIPGLGRSPNNIIHSVGCLVQDKPNSGDFFPR